MTGNLMDDNNKKLIEKLSKDQQKVYDLFSSLNECEWNMEVYVNWKVRDILAHFISAEKAFLELFESIRLSSGELPNDFSIDDYNNSEIEKYKNIRPNDLIKDFMNTRNKTIDWVRQVKADELDLIGRHPAMGYTKLREMIRMICLHNQIHIRDVSAILKPNLYSSNLK